MRPFKDSLHGEHLRTWCDGCGTLLGNVPQVTPFLDMAAEKTP
jgi:hypothetical protein